jgi:hypothetical protein
MQLDQVRAQEPVASKWQQGFNFNAHNMIEASLYL